MADDTVSKRTWVGRAATAHPANRFITTRCVPDDEQLDDDDLGAGKTSTQFFADDSVSIISENHSPDIPFRYSLNPYRGCEHGCAYCYARPTHEYLGWNAGIDFESRILVKEEAATLLRKKLDSPSWRGETIAMSGVTDCYQPAERKFRITRACLAVANEYHQPIEIVTKNRLVVRDIDILSEMATRSQVRINISLTTLEPDLARVMEPRTSHPTARLRAISELVAAGIPTRVMIAPVIPGLNDHEIASILEAAAAAGAAHASYVLLRLPESVMPVFVGWLEDRLPDHREKVLGRQRAARGGQLSDSRFGQRMRGEGPYAAGIGQSFQIFARKFGLDRPLSPLDTTSFRRPTPPDRQGRLFADEEDG